MNQTDRINMKFSSEDLDALRLIAAAMQKRMRSPFVSPSDCVREALRLARERVISDGLKGAAR
jgi:hypothetical protein